MQTSVHTTLFKNLWKINDVRITARSSAPDLMAEVVLKLEEFCGNKRSWSSGPSDDQ